MRSRHAAFVAVLVVACAAGAALAMAQAIAPRLLTVTVGRAGVDASGFLKITGEVRNTSEEWACTPVLEVELFDTRGKALAVDSIVTATRSERGKPALDGVTAERTFLPPGEVAVFEYTRDAKKIRGEYAKHRVSARARKCPAQPRVVIEGLLAQKGGDGWYSVRGRIKNVGEVGCRSAKAVIGCYEASGALHRADSVQPDEAFQQLLAPGQSVAFSLESIENPGGNTISEVKAWADCALPE